MDKPVIVIADPSGEGLALPDVLMDRYESIVVSRPDDVMEVVRSRGPAAVVVDFPFPTTGGECLVRALRSDPTTSEAPVVAFSSWNYVRTRAKAREYGCASFVPHSEGPRKVAKVLDRLTRRQPVG